MPRKEFHDLFEKLFLGELTGMSDMMDAPVALLHGQHRVVLHDPLQIGVLSMMKGGDPIKNMAAGMLHVFLDNAISTGTHELKQYVKQENKKKSESVIRVPKKIKK